LTGKRNPGEGRKRATKALFFAAVLSLFAGCGAKSITTGSIPFPTEKPVLRTEGGKETAALPPSPEPVHLVFFDAPWCPQCGEAWDAIGSAASTFPPGSVHVYRIRFEQERIYTAGGSREVPPLPRTSTPAGTSSPPDSPPIPITTLEALPGPFRKQFWVGQVPVLLLLDENGRVEKQWTGYSPSLRESLAEEVRRITTSPSPSGK
jgi:hypothetical protein